MAALRKWTGGRRKGTQALVGLGLLVAAAIAAVAIWQPWHESRPSVVSATTSTSPPPAALTVPAGLRNPGLDATGIESDGWLSKDSALTLAGGRAGVLTVRGEVLPADGQQLAVVVDGRQVDARPVGAGPLDVRVLLPAAGTSRRIELRFALEVKLEPPDKRVAAARLASISVQPMTTAPSSLTLPAALSRANVISSGVYADGWTGKRASFVLAGGAPAVLAISAEVLAPRGAAQTLHIAVNGKSVLDAPVADGRANLRTLLPASRGPRQVDLAWARAMKVSSTDPRELSAQIARIGVEPLRGPPQIRFPEALERKGVTVSGVDADGWAHKDVRAVLAGGRAGILMVEAETITTPQIVAVFVNGTPVASADLAPGTSTLRIPVGASRGARLIELRFARVARISAVDPRRGATLLRGMAVQGVGQAAPKVFLLPADLKTSRAAQTGIYGDGWAQQNVRLLLAGGPGTTLSIEAQTLLQGQRMTVLVNGRLLDSEPMRAGNDVVHVDVPASSDPRLVELRFARVAPIASNDPRLASTLLRAIGLARAAHASTAGRVAASLRLHAQLTTAAEVPPHSGSGSGTFTATLRGRTLRWHVRVVNLSTSVVATVIRAGELGHVGPRLLYLCSPCADDVAGTVELTREQVRTIRHRATYVNVGTSETPEGEIRGQLTSS